MQHDDMIWQIINNQFCSYKTTIGSAKSDKQHFCRHPHSVTGLCNRTACPLANSKYATVREDAGRVSLYLKTVERAHSPKNLWEKITLSRNYTKALQQIDEHLAFFPKPLIHRNKQRLTKIHQYLIRMRKIKLKELAGKKARVVGVNRKVEQREGRREKKALVAAKVEANIEKELVERLARGTYGDIYNFPEVPYQKALEEAERAAGRGEEEEEGSEEEGEMEEEEEESDEEEGEIEYVEDLEEEEESSDEEETEMEDMEYGGEYESDESEESHDETEESDVSDTDGSSSDSDDVEGKREKSPPKSKKKKPKPRTGGTRIEIEYEDEDEGGRQLANVGGGQEDEAGMAW